MITPRASHRLDLSIYGPRLNVPFDFGSVFIDLGMLRVTSEPARARATTDSKPSPSAPETTGYFDHYEVGISSVQASITQGSTDDVVPVLEPFSGSFAIDVCPFPLCTPNPRIVMSGKLSPVSFLVDLDAVSALWSASSVISLLGKAAHEFRNDSAAVAPDFSPFWSPVNPQQRNLQLDVSLEKLVVTLSKGKSIPIARASMDGLSLSLLSRTYDVQLRVRLASLSVDDLLEPGDARKIVESRQAGTGSAPLIIVNVLSCTPRSPLHSSERLRVDIDFDTLLVTFCRETADVIVAHMQDPLSKLTGFSEAVAISVGAGSSTPRKRPVPTTITVHVRSLSVLLVQRKTRIGLGELRDLAVVVAKRAKATKITMLCGPAKVFTDDPREPREAFFLGEEGARTTVITLEKRAPSQSFLRVRVGEARALVAIQFWNNVFDCLSGVRKIVPKSEHHIEVFVGKFVASVPIPSGDAAGMVEVRLSTLFGRSEVGDKRTFRCTLEVSALACHTGRESQALLDPTQISVGAEIAAGAPPKFSANASLSLRVNSDHLAAAMSVFSAVVSSFDGTSALGGTAEAPSMAATFSLQLPKLSVSLESSEPFKASGSPPQLALVEASGTTVFFSFDKAMKLGFLTDSFVVNDSRLAAKPVFSLGPRPSRKRQEVPSRAEPDQPKSPPVVFWLSRPTESPQLSLALQLEDLRIDFVPAFVSEVLSQYAELVKPLTSDKERPPSPQGTALPIVSEFTASVSGFSLVVPEKTGEFAVHLSTYIRFSEKEVSALFEGVGVAHVSSQAATSSSSEIVTQQLLRPFDVSVKWARPPESTLNVSISALRFTLSPQDVIGAKALLDIPSFLPTGIFSASPVPASPKQLQFPTLSVKTCGMRALLLADRSSKSVPLLKIKCASFECNARSVEERVEAFAMMAWKASFFNLAKTSWEPLVEPWECRLELSGRTRRPWDLNASLSSPSRMNINITKPFYRAIVDGALLPNSSGRAAPFHPVLLRNLSGVRVSIVPGREEPPVQVESGEEVPIEARGPKGKKFSIALRFEGYTQQQTLSYEKLKAIELTLSPVDDEDDPAVFMVSVTLQEGSKVITVSSPVIVENKTTLPLVFRVQRGQSVIYTSGPLEVGRQAGVPPGLLRERWNATLSVKLLADGSSWALLPIELSRRPSGSRVIPIKSDSHALNARVVGSSAHRGSACRFHVISMRPPVVLENLLPDAVRFDVIVSGKSCAQGSLERGEAVALYHVEYQQAAELLVALPGFTCTHPASITSEPAHGRIKLCRERDRPLAIDVETSIDEAGSRHVALFSRYWIVNATGLQMFFFAISGVRKVPIPAQRPPPVDLLHSPRDAPFFPREHLSAATPIMFCPEDSVAEGGGVASVSFRTSGSKVSKAFDIDSVGVPREISVFEQKLPSQEYRHMFSFGVTIEFAQGKFHRTKVITVKPRFLLVNRCLRDIYYKQFGLGVNFVYTLPPNSVLPFHWPNKAGTLLVTISLAPTSEFGCWSGGFSISDIGRFCVKVPSVGGAQDASEFLWVDVAMNAATLVVSFSPCPRERPAYRIDNRTQIPAVVCQLDVGKPSTVPAGSSVPYAWDEPTRPKRKLAVTVLHQPAAVTFPKAMNVDKIGSHSSVVVSPGTAVHAIVRLDGRVKVLLLESGPDDAPAPSASPAPREGDGEQLLPIAGDRLTVSVVLHGVSISFVNSAPRELLYASVDGIRLQYRSNEAKESFEASAEGVQVDNQLHMCSYPVLLCAADRSRGARMLSVSAIRSRRYRSEVQYFEYLAVLVNEFNLSVDEALVNGLIDFLGLASAGPEPAPRPELAVEQAAPSGDSRVVYFELLHINPVKCNFSFNGASTEEDAEGGGGGGGGGGAAEERATNPLREMLGGMSLLSAEMVPITLSALLMQNPFFAENEFARTLGEYYRSQLLRQLYSVVLHLDCIGAPMMLFNFCGRGLLDFFYEPAAGFVKSPDEFARGLSKGAQSLVRNNVLGIFNSGKKLLGTLGMGVASLSMDRDYQRGHLLSSAKDPKHLGEGLLFGAKDFGKGVVRGFAGVVTEPIKGAQREGVAGFVKGIGLGMVGVAVKPTVGVLDMATQTAKGIINTATFFEAKAQRMRPPRHFAPDGILRDYDEQSAAGQTILFTVAKGKFRSDVYAFHADLPAAASPGKTVLVSQSHIFLLRRESDRFSVDFLLSIRDIGKLEKLEGELRLHVKQAGTLQPPQQLWRSIFTGTSPQGVDLLNRLTAIVTALWAQHDDS